MENGEPARGVISVLDKDRVYIAYKLPQTRLDAIVPASRDYLGTNNTSDGMEGLFAIHSYLVALMIMVAYALAKKQSRIVLAKKVIPLLLVVALLAGAIPHQINAAAQEATVLETPGNKTMDILAGGNITLSFKASYSDSYQSLVLLDLYLPSGFEPARVNATMDGTLLNTTLEEVGQGHYRLFITDLQPPNGILKIDVTVKTSRTPGVNDIRWKFTVQAMSKLSPMQPVDSSGIVEVNLEPVTTPSQNNTVTTTPPMGSTSSQQPGTPSAPGGVAGSSQQSGSVAYTTTTARGGGGSSTLLLAAGILVGLLVGVGLTLFYTRRGAR